MTVKELIDILKTYDPALIVYRNDSEGQSYPLDYDEIQEIRTSSKNLRTLQIGPED